MSIGVMHNNQQEKFPKRVFIKADGSDLTVHRGEVLRYRPTEDEKTLNQVYKLDSTDANNKILAGVAKNTIHVKDGQIGHLVIDEPGSIVVAQCNADGANRSPGTVLRWEQNAAAFGSGNAGGRLKRVASGEGRGYAILLEQLDNSDSPALRKVYLDDGTRAVSA